MKLLPVTLLSVSRSACLGAYDNTSPPVEEMVPGGYDFMKLRVQLAVPVPEVIKLY